MGYKRLLAVFLALLLGTSISASKGSDRWSQPARAQANSPQPTHKVTAPPGLLQPSQEIQLLVDYGSFTLYRISDHALAALPESVRAQVSLADGMDQIELNGSTISTAGPAAALQKKPAKHNAGEALYLVQFIGPVLPEWPEQIEALGVEIVQYLPENAYLVWADAPERQMLDNLAASGDLIQFSAPYEATEKISPVLAKEIANSAPDRVLTIVLQVYRHPQVQQTRKELDSLGAVLVGRWEKVLDFQNATLDIPAGNVLQAAQLPDVVWIDAYQQPELLDEVQGQILAGSLTADGSLPTSPGYLEWLVGLGFSQNPTDYPVIDITDDGIGNGSINSGDPTLNLLGSALGASRLAYNNNCTTDSTASSIGGHGHINTSIAGGYDTRLGFPYEDSSAYQLGLGINPFGRLAGTKIFGSAGYSAVNCGGTDQGVIEASYNAGARISSNSWGHDSSTYDIGAQTYDAAVRDALPNTPGDQPLVVIFSAGNSGSTSATISSPGSGKNVITVGASENVRPTWTDRCGITPTGADNANDIADFSSRGPAPGLRVKPEVVAPGTHIQGTASTAVGYTGGNICDQYYPGSQITFAASSGTSHSAPSVAGVASLYDYWLEQTYGLIDPSPAMIKAYLITHPAYLTGVSANDTLPSNNQGFGRPDLETAFDSAYRFLLDQTAILDATGETWTWNGSVVDPDLPVRIVMAYTDAPGAVGTTPQVNNLDLTASVGATAYLGNHFLGAWSTTGGAADPYNNYEAIFLPAGTAGPIQITVRASNLPGDGVPSTGDTTDQDFALICYNCASQPDFTITVDPVDVKVCAPNPAAYTVSVGSILGFSQDVHLAAEGLPTGAGASFSINPVTPPGDSILQVLPGSASAGTYTFSVTGTSGPLTRQDTARLTIYTGYPGIPELLLPADGAVDQPLRPVLQWQPISQADEIHIDIATDPEFNNIVAAYTIPNVESFAVPQNLASSTRYYWRVWAGNTCAPGELSAIFTFTTLALPGDCPADVTPSIIYEENFESGFNGWTHEGIADTWTIQSSLFYSPEHAFHADAPAEVTDQRLASPTVTLPTGERSISLKYWTQMDIERGSVSCFDGAILELLSEGSSTWQQVGNSQLLTIPYDLPVNTSFGNPLAGQMAWCDESAEWKLSVVDLGPYAGETIQLGFRLGTDTSVIRPGWTIDDVSIQSCGWGDLKYRYYFPLVFQSSP